MNHGVIGDHHTYFESARFKTEDEPKQIDMAAGML
jgi:hypothetical protein